MRGQGVFTRIWNMLSQRFGEFYIEAPYSEAMQKFLDRHGIGKERRCGVQGMLEPGDIHFVDGHPKWRREW